jgi:hypothetical protein
MALVLAALTQAAACTTSPSNVDAQYVSPTTYQSWSCPQLLDEKARLASEVARVSNLQRENANADTAIVAAGIILAPILLIGLAATKDRKSELAKLKGESDAVDTSIAAKQCSMPAGGAPNSSSAPLVATAPAVSYAGTYAGRGTTESYCQTPAISITIDGASLSGTLSEVSNGSATGTISGEVLPNGQIVANVKSGNSQNVNGTFRGTVTQAALNIEMKQPAPNNCPYKFSVARK